MKLKHINLTENSYKEHFLPIDEIWKDSILRSFTMGEMSENDRKFMIKIANYFNNKYGNMIFHFNDDKYIKHITDTSWEFLMRDSTRDNIIKVIKYIDSEIKKLIRSGIIAPKGQHNMENDFWLNDKFKQRYMHGEI